MSFKPYPITFKNSGLIKNKKPFLLMDDAFQQLNNAYNWREAIKKREGIKLVGRLRRCFTMDITLSTQANGASYTVADLFVAADIEGVSGEITGVTNASPGEITTGTPHNLIDGTIVFISDVGGTTQLNGNSYTITVTGATTFTIGVDTTLYGVYTTGGEWTTQPNKQIEPGTIQITVGAIVFTDANSDGILTDGGTNTGNINYTTGELNLAFSPAIGATDVDVQFCYYPSLPVMGIPQQEVAAINLEQTLFFDTKYIYTHGGNDFAASSSTTWSGDDSEFFWGTNYRGSDANDRLFFVTNNTDPNTSANNRIRYTSDAATWTDFTPALEGTAITSESVGTLAAATTPFNGTIGNTPIIPGTVTITMTDTDGSGTDPDIRFKDDSNGVLNGSPSANTGTIDYDTGDISLNIDADDLFTKEATIYATYQYETSYLYQAKIILPYYGRLLAFNTYEGSTAAAASTNNIFNRCRFSQIGNPIQDDAWISTIFGKGGFVDAPTNQAIVSARFFKNTLIVIFERSTWQLRYVGEYGLPFVWERISSDFGSESTFSTILFDNGILAVGDKAIVSSSGNDVQRIDLDIPDTVFDFHNQDNGKERVQGIRDFHKEIVFWTYSDGGLGKKFPNRTLLYNYRNNTWAIFRDNVTAFGTLASPTGDSWDDPISWDSDTPWDNFLQPEQPIVISGNQQGFVHFYQFELDPETTKDNQIDLREHESLYIKDITRSATASLSLEIPDHNLEAQDVIYISNLLFVNTSNNTALETSLNDKFYLVNSVTDDDNVVLWQYNITTGEYENTKGNNIGFTPATGTGTYMGGGVVALISKLDIITKDFNPVVTQKVKSSYTDFQTDGTPNSEVSINIYVDANINPQEKANLDVYDPNMETALNQTGVITDITAANPAVVTSANHGLLNGREVTFGEVGGMTEIEGLKGFTTYLTNDTFSVDIDTSGFTAYTNGGQWWTQDDNPYYISGSNYAWHRFYSNVHGQYIAYNITYNDELMNNPVTHKSDFQMNAMILHIREAGGLIT